MPPASKELVVAVIGYTGGVGTCLLKAMNQIHLKPFALVRSTTMRVGNDSDDSPVDFASLGERLLEEASKTNGGNAVPVIADVTASLAVQKRYTDWLRAGISVVTANKGIFAGKEANYQALLAASKEGGARILHETTVGAGLPVLGTIQGLVASSHQIQKVEGILSGTLAFVLGQVAGGKKTLSQAVKDAKFLGYTEPDPRDDLNGMDVARKAVILARLSGLTGIELGSMHIESLVPEPLRICSMDEFMKEMHLYDDELAKRVKDVEDSGGRLHYAAKVDVINKKVTVGLLSCEDSHPFNRAGPDNMVAITTNHYTRPLVVQGAGAGGDVTATGVLADILQCAYQ